MKNKPITGLKVFIVFCSSFGVVIAVNLVLAFKAVATYPGLEVRNSYVASQNFDAERAAQQALGWDVQAVVVDDELTLAINDRHGNPVRLAELSATLGRATHIKDDRTPKFNFNGAVYVASVNINAGNWNLRMTAESPEGVTFKKRLVVQVRD